MKWQTKHLKQDAVYWPPDEYDQSGMLVHGSPIPLKVRWQGKAEMFRTDEGQELVSSAVVYAGQELEVGGKIALGAFGQASLSDAREIRQKELHINLRASKQALKVYL